jgi:gamma-tubulin complex component 2
MFKILSIETEEECEYKGTGNSSDLTTLEAMAFGYDVQWPISLILNRRSLAMYQVSML